MRHFVAGLGGLLVIRISETPRGATVRTIGHNLCVCQASVTDRGRCDENHVAAVCDGTDDRLRHLSCDVCKGEEP